MTSTQQTWEHVWDLVTDGDDHRVIVGKHGIDSKLRCAPRLKIAHVKDGLSGL